MSWTDNDSTLEWSYDSLGRAVSEKSGANPLGTTGKTFSFGYDSTGNTTSIGYPDGTTLNYARDAVGRMTSASLQGGATLGTYQYAGSRVLSIALQNAVTRTLTYDAAWRATFVEYKTATTSIKKFEYAWNVADKRVLEKRHHSGGTGDNYDLDSLYRSIQVKAGVADPVAELATPGSQTVASTTGLTMDTANNRTQRVVATGTGQTTTNYAADALEFYTSVGGTTNTRDANGNLRDDGTNLYAYDYRNRLVTVTRKSDSVVIAGYEYDSLSRRVGVTTSIGTARHCWIGAQLAMEYGSNGGVVSRRHYGANAGEVLAAQQLDVADLDGDGSTVDSVSITPLYDGAFDCVGSLDQTGALAESYVHSFDGTVTITNGAGQAIAASAIGWQQGYGRGYRDVQTGFVYNLHRYYSPSTGRFLTQDPLGRWYDASSLGNGYAWVGNGFRNAWDPLGYGPTSDRAPSIPAAVRPLVQSIADAAGESTLAGGEGQHMEGYAVQNLGEIVRDVDIVFAPVAHGSAGIDIPMGYREPRPQKEGRHKGKYLMYIDPKWWATASKGEKLFVLVHEYNHVAQMRCSSKGRRRHPRNPWKEKSEKRWKSMWRYQTDIWRMFKYMATNAYTGEFGKMKSGKGDGKKTLGEAAAYYNSWRPGGPRQRGE